MRLDPLDGEVVAKGGYPIALASEVDRDGWRDHARRLAQESIPPEQVTWTVEGRSDTGSLDLSPPAIFPANNGEQSPRPIRMSKTLFSLINTALLHRNQDRFDLAYRVLYRAQSVPDLHLNPADADVIKLNRYAKAIRRDIHKMHAFVRFRKIGDSEGREQFVAWFEPDHHITAAVAPFFRNRFTGMDWLIVTPEASIAWDGEKLSIGPGGCKDDVPQEDVVEAEWRTYYANIFNPARVKISAMKSEMPMKYWKNLPEAELIPSLLEQAGTRVHAMVSRPTEALLVDQVTDQSATNLPASLEQLYAMLEQQTDAPVEKFSEKLIRGSGPDNADIMIIGEQPGDQEDRQGRPFVGPAGQLLDRALEQAGIDRQKTFLTNAV
ncbi:TIGR03915 family putative DNA repair protein, partial [Parasphingorhabdus sp.]|uniref:TIGR03915 family putative DNA repair protein n=1 Tax=Parasphingorhabdus sp. TaxID=2709688 RepID=UPI003C784D8B